MKKKDEVYMIFILFVLFSSFVFGAVPAEERAALIALYNSTNGDNWTNNSGWKEPPLDTDGFSMPGTEGSWYGITVSGAYVTEIVLEANLLSGKIPQDLGNLINLTKLNLGGNELSGNIPAEIGNLIKLKNLLLGWSNLSGIIPAELFDLMNLTYLNLGGNDFSNIKLVDFVKLKNLKFLNLKRSNLSGSIPAEFFTLSQLESLWISGNRLSGSIPPEIGTLSNLMFLDLSTNNFTGNLPPELFNLIKLREIFIAWNGLTGTIPPGIGNFSNLSKLHLHGNNLSGSIPTELGNLVNLESLRLNLNKLNGQIPNSLTNLTKLSSPNVDIGYNCLATDDPGLRAWLDHVDPDWDSHQNECGFTLTVQSSPDTGVPITVSPGDNYGQTNGNTEFYRTYDIDIVVTLTAPSSYSGKNFTKWLIDGAENTSRTIQVTMDKNHTAKAVYQTLTNILTVQSFPGSGIGILVSPSDKNGNGDGNTNFTRTYDSETEVTLMAPSSFNDNDFIKWTVDGQDYNYRTLQVTMDTNHTAVVYYSASPEISINRTSLNFGYIIGSGNLPIESFNITNSGGGTLNWTATCEVQNVSLSPGSGSNSGVVEVSIDPVGLMPGKFKGVIYVADPLASNSPVEVEINLWVKAQSDSSPPFGEFSTPINNSVVRSSVPVTGWVLGDSGIENVKIYREDGRNLVYIGDAVFVEGARPDVEAAYPDYPMNYKAGWGYMMLTYFLPNKGNGIFKIHAVAADKQGRQTTLGIKTITVDNAHAVKPFGAIDTPTQGGTALGSKYTNWGWVLTPLPGYIPIDGHTINVYVDGVNLGHPTYNIFRSDIANLFPEYSNSSGAAGYFTLDTTTYENGVHTIQWTATDSAGNTDGIGSRYFTIENSGAGSQQSLVNGKGSLVISHWSLGDKRLSAIPINYHEPVIMKKGCGGNLISKEIYPGSNGIITVEISELGRVEINFGSPGLMGFQVIGDQLKPLPIGSFIDREKGIFYWQPGVGFYGIYEFVFIKADGTDQRKLRVKILPKYLNPME
jgi:hypothetical protein